MRGSLLQTTVALQVQLRSGCMQCTAHELVTQQATSTVPCAGDVGQLQEGLARRVVRVSKAAVEAIGAVILGNSVSPLAPHEYVTQDTGCAAVHGVVHEITVADLAQVMTQTQYYSQVMTDHTKLHAESKHATICRLANLLVIYARHPGLYTQGCTIQRK